MSEDIKKVPDEVKDEDLEQVAGGWTREELKESKILGEFGKCKIPQLNK